MNEPKRMGPLRRLFGAAWGFVSWLRAALANLLFLAMMAIILVVLNADGMPRVPARAALLLEPSGRIVEQLDLGAPLADLLQREERPPRETLLKDVLDAIRHATDDKRIAAIVLSTDLLDGAGITKTRDIAAALAAYRATGRRIIAVGDSFSQDQYLLAAQADEIWMHPMGMVDLSGIGAFRTYFKGTLDKLKIDVRVFRAGTFKSAFESFERSDMSDADKLATGELITAIWHRFGAIVSERRKLPPDAVDHYANQFDRILAQHAGDAAAAAREYGFVDELRTRDQINKALVDLVGGDEDGDFRRVGFREYLRAMRAPLRLEAASGKPAVGVLVASGTILDGRQPAGAIGGDTLAAAIRAAARDEDIKALVLRIDSPGGSGFASEVIRNALLDFRAVGKPLVASMGSVAASGGYWIAAPADEIWASETTITGSIGVLSAFPSFARGLAEIGVTTDGIGTTTMAGGPDPARPLSAQWESVLEQLNRNAYRRFIAIVAEGRSLEPEKVAEIAEGRVWTGEQAVSNGLVDQIGGLDQAIAAAAKLARLEAPATRWLEPPSDWRTRLLEALAIAPDAFLTRVFGATGSKVLGKERWLEQMLRTADPRTPWALCTVCAAF